MGLSSSVPCSGPGGLYPGAGKSRSPGGQQGGGALFGGAGADHYFLGRFGKGNKGAVHGIRGRPFARIALDMGVPAEAIFIENKSTNTGENILFTQQMLEDKGLYPESFLLVQKPYMERRSYATFNKHWPEKELIVTSPQIAFEDYPTPEMPMERVIELMVGDLQRIRIYPEKGFQIPQEIPVEIWSAYEKLVAWGYVGHLVD